MKLTGSEIVIECLKEQGVDTVFGYPGGAILNIYDELYKHSDEIHHILTSHEQGASHAADGYARATGKVGVCIATSGPGATNLVTGIATAYMDSVPIVAITANVSVPLLGRDSFQEVDITGITMPITKHNFIVKEVDKLADTIRDAFRIAREGRPGPVLIDITKDVTAGSAEYAPVKPEPIERSVEYIKETDIQQAVDMINECSRPFVFVGGGAVISDAEEELKTFVDKLHAPVADSLMGKGAYSGENELYCGMLGMHGTKAANLGVTKCDLLITVGSRFSDRVVGQAKSFAKNAKIIQIDVDPAEINKNILVDCSIIGDVREVLKRLNARIEEHRHDEWDEEIKELKKKYPLKYDHSVLTRTVYYGRDQPPDKGRCDHRDRSRTAPDVGCTVLQVLQSRAGFADLRRTWNDGIRARCFALEPRWACPDKTVINIAGDGCFRMNMNELATAARYNIPVIEVVINNHVLGMVRQWQTLFYGKRYSQTILDDSVDFVKLAEALGVEACRVTKPEEFGPALAHAVSLGKPYLIDCMIGSDDKVFPMVPAGKPIETVFDQDDLDK